MTYIYYRHFMLIETSFLPNFNWTGRSESLLRCAWARRKPPRRGSLRDDWSKCDWMHWWIKNSNIWWLELTLPHTLWSKTQCFTISWTCFHHCWTFEKEQDQIAATSCQCWTVKVALESENQQEENIFVLFFFFLPTYLIDGWSYMWTWTWSDLDRAYVVFCVCMCILLLPSNAFELGRTRVLLLIMKRKRFNCVGYGYLLSLTASIMSGSSFFSVNFWHLSFGSIWQGFFFFSTIRWQHYRVSKLILHMSTQTSHH